MKTRMFIIAATITALAFGAVGLSLAEQQATTSCCSYMQSNVCAQYMQGLTAGQRIDLDGNLQRKVEPAGPENYPAGLKYYPAPGF